MSSQKRMSLEALRIRRSLRALDQFFRRFVPLLTAVAQNAPKNEKPRRQPRFSAKARASLVLQGRYMGYMRQLKPKQKAQVRKVREAKGVRVAIARARQLAGAAK